ncbi:SpoIIE family protein phosphatase [Streptomyces sp. RB6PN25]|uniref:SpoIIE family protein phosphatase n=1 Tax=Streptomyces humicola TaxID=2953240 RepID=A0ABT1PT83_9ACTN|nr:SpoIIE family protein phosphatase [Streptomyces humicola]MCQ4080155.1 SpoIIE family protein phosphatase [Streptomyces humicola]
MSTSPEPLQPSAKLPPPPTHTHLHPASSHGRGGLQPAGPPSAASGGLLDTLRVGVVMLDTRGRVVLWSPLAEEMLGWAGEHIVGRRLDTIIKPWAGTEAREAPAGSGAEAPHRGRVPPPGPAERLMAELLRSGRWGGVLPLRHRDGHTVFAEVRASLLVDGDGKPFVLASIAETHLLRGVEHDLALIDAVFDTSPLGIAVYDTDLRCVRVNQALCRMDDLPAEDHIGRTVDEILLGETGDDLAIVQKTVLDTGRTVLDLRTPGPHGRGMRSSSYSRITDRAGHVLGVSAVVMDITDRFLSAAKVERARTRLALLNDVGASLADLLDVDRIARALAEALVPAFCDYAGVLLVRAVPRGGELPRHSHTPGTPLVLLGAASPPGDVQIAPLLQPGMVMTFPAGSPLSDVLASGPAWFAETPADLGGGLPVEALDPRIRKALELGIGSALAVPLRARGVVLGLLVGCRDGEREPFDPDDLALATELSDRAGAALDNARLYARERQGALMLQRSLLPQHVPEPPGIEIAYRYVPGSTGAEVGGDWFDVIPLAGGRTAFVVGDVMGHGLRAAATMGRLRTAVRTLAGLDLTPDELLRRINNLSDDFMQTPEEPMMATVVYAVYEPSTRRCSIARAGHLPPLLVRYDDIGFDCTVQRLELPSGTPIGVEGSDFESEELDVPDGSVLVLYTDGLVERRGQDLTTGIDQLVAVLGRRHASLEDACDEVLSTLVPPLEPDDVAVLMARLGGLPEGSAAFWEFSAEASAVRQARLHVGETLAAWGLAALTDVTILLVSELVTNSLRHAHGPIGVRMVRGTSLLVEVSDPLPEPPRTRSAAHDDEGGRGMQLVARASRRWGTRQGPLGKTVWFELALPGN